VAARGSHAPPHWRRVVHTPPQENQRILTASSLLPFLISDDKHRLPSKVEKYTR